MELNKVGKVSVFVARQAIFNRRQKVVAYELLFRDSPKNFFPDIAEGQATARLIMENQLNLGTRHITSGKKALINIGVPAAFEQAFFQGGLLIFMVFLASYGSAPFAAYGIGLSILGIVIVVAFSFSISSATLVSQHLGAGDLKGAYQAGWKTMRTSLYFMVTGGVLMSLFAEQIARFMIDDPQVIHHMVQFTYILSACLPMMAIEFSMAGALRGAGDTRYPMMVTVFSILLTRIIAPWILVRMGADVVWLYATSLVDFSIKSSLNMRRFRKKDWLKGHQQK